MGKMARRSFLKAGVLWTAAICSFSPSLLQAAEVLDYDLLSSVLYPKTEEEKEYLKKVLSLMNSRKLPRSIVYSAYRFALKKPKSRRMKYFDQGLRLLCKKSNIKFSLSLS